MLEHELMIFLKHTDKRIIDVILREHSHCGHEDWIFRKCLDYYLKMMGREPYEDGV